MPQAVILEHTLASQPFQLRKDREYAACRICGALFQDHLAVATPNHLYTDELAAAVGYRTKQWRDKHNTRHSDSEHQLFRQSGRTFSPEAAFRLAPYGIVSIGDSTDDEVARAMLESPRIPDNNPEGS